jgi:hypothetical protein
VKLYYVESHGQHPGNWHTTWSVYKRTNGGGDRHVCRASSEKTARRIAAALNATDAQTPNTTSRG